METIKIVKIGGNVVDNPDALASFLEDFSKITGKKILVHGGGKIASKIGRSLGIEPVMIDGRRVTDRPTLDVVTMVYGGLINKNIVATLVGHGVSALGLTGADGALIRSARRNPEPVDYGYVGDPRKVNTSLLVSLLDSGIVPIVAPLTISIQNEILNTNADTMAQTLATALAEIYDTQLIYTFELEGVLDNEQRLIEHIDRSTFETLKADGTVSGGMLPKLENALCAIDRGVRSVMIGSTVISN